MEDDDAATVDSDMSSSTSGKASDSSRKLRLQVPGLAWTRSFESYYEKVVSPRKPAAGTPPSEVSDRVEDAALVEIGLSRKPQTVFVYVLVALIGNMPNAALHVAGEQGCLPLIDHVSVW